MREIKFRLRIGNKIVGYEKWYSGYSVEDDPCSAEPCWLYSKDGEKWNPDYIYHKQKDTYTGLKDKNGNEIYESDILQYKNCKNASVVVWGLGGWRCRVETPKGQRDYCITDHYDVFESENPSLDEHLIIGNEFENPELLKRGEK